MYAKKTYIKYDDKGKKINLVKLILAKINFT